jgi:hypothetical protein
MGMQPIDISLGLAGPTTAAARAAAMTNLQAAQDVAALDARRNQAVIGGLSDPVAALIGALTKTPQPNFSTIGYTGPGRGDYF